MDPGQTRTRRRNDYYHYNSRYESVFWWGFCIFGFVFFVIAVVWITGFAPHAYVSSSSSSSASASAASTPSRFGERSVESSAPRFHLENHWIQTEPGVFDLGSAHYVSPKDGHVEKVHGFAHMIYADGHGPTQSKRSVHEDELPTNGTEATSCSVPLGANVRWSDTMEWIIDPTNGEGIPRDFILDALWNAVNQFERRLPTPVMRGQDTTSCADGIDLDSPDGKNEIMFGFIEESGVLAVMIGWTNRDNQLVNTDILFNLHFDWGDGSTNSEVYDIENVATHEVGHAYGQGHINVNDATMEPTASRGEIKKRDLLACEAAGLCIMYGESAGACSTLSRSAVPRFIDVGSSSRCDGTELPPRSAASTVIVKEIGYYVIAVVALFIEW